MKIVLALPPDLLKDIDAIAKEDRLSRKEVIALAIREYGERRRTVKLLASENAAYDDAEMSSRKQQRRGAEKDEQSA